MSTKKKVTKKVATKRDDLTVDQLLAKLSSTQDQDEKARLRARLRARGHKGGLRNTEYAPEPKAKPKAAAGGARKKKVIKKKVARKTAPAEAAESTGE